MGNGARVETEAPAIGESRRQQLLPRPKATAPAADSTLFCCRGPPNTRPALVRRARRALGCAETQFCAPGVTSGAPQPVFSRRKPSATSRKAVLAGTGRPRAHSRRLQRARRHLVRAASCSPMEVRSRFGAVPAAYGSKPGTVRTQPKRRTPFDRDAYGHSPKWPELCTCSIDRPMNGGIIRKEQK